MEGRSGGASHRRGFGLLQGTPGGGARACRRRRGCGDGVARPSATEAGDRREHGQRKASAKGGAALGAGAAHWWCGEKRGRESKKQKQKQEQQQKQDGGDKPGAAPPPASITSSQLISPPCGLTITRGTLEGILAVEKMRTQQKGKGSPTYYFSTTVVRRT